MQLFRKRTRATRIHDLVRQIKAIRPDLSGQSDHEVISTYLNDELIADYRQNVHYHTQPATASAQAARPAGKPTLSRLFEETLLATADESMAYYIKLTHQLLFANQELSRQIARLEERESGEKARTPFSQSSWWSQSEQYGQREG